MNSDDPDAFPDPYLPRLRPAGWDADHYLPRMHPAAWAQWWTTVGHDNLAYCPCGDVAVDTYLVNGAGRVLHMRAGRGTCPVHAGLERDDLGLFLGGQAEWLATELPAPVRQTAGFD